MCLYTRTTSASYYALLIESAHFDNELELRRRRISLRSYLFQLDKEQKQQLKQREEIELV